MLQSPAEEGKMGGNLQCLENFTPDVSDYDPAEVREVNLKRAQQLFKVIYQNRTMWTIDFRNNLNSNWTDPLYRPTADRHPILYRLSFNLDGTTRFFYSTRPIIGLFDLTNYFSLV